MRQHIVEIDGSSIRDFASFHDVFAAAFGFPAYYGRNMDAWIDCMSNPATDWSRVVAADDDTVIVRIKNADDIRAAAPDVWEALSTVLPSSLPGRCKVTRPRGSSWHGADLTTRSIPR